MAQGANGDAKPGVDGARFITKSAFARLIDVRPSMISKYIKQERILLTADGLVDVETSMALLRNSLDPARGGKGGWSSRRDRFESPRRVATPDPPPMPAATDDDDDDYCRPGPAGCSRTDFPADERFHEIADWMREAVLNVLVFAFDAHERAGRAAGMKEFRDWLEPGTAGLARKIQERVVELERSPHKAKPAH